MAPNDSSSAALDSTKLEVLTGSVGNRLTGEATYEFASITGAELQMSIVAPSRHEKANRIRIV
jgi:hypothetical protein